MSNVHLSSYQKWGWRKKTSLLEAEQNKHTEAEENGEKQINLLDFAFIFV